MSDAFWARGSLLQLGDGLATEAFSSIAEITKLTPISMKRDSIDVTSHQSPDGYKEFIAGMRDAGEVDCEANWLPTNATQDATTGLLGSFNDDRNHHWKVVLPDNLLTIGLVGHVSEFEGDLPLEKQGTLKFKIKLSGKPTFS